uniref:Uncharacterized protein n=1 Tax=Anguilla anguilla TaxID=7936 RepID=A0A0E9VMW9_ANGAN
MKDFHVRSNPFSIRMKYKGLLSD